MLDTNIISDIAHNPTGGAAKRLAEVDPDDVVTSVVVAAEIWFGVEKNPSFRSRARTESFMQTIRVLELRPEVARVYGRVRAGASASGQPIGPNDLFIAADALALDATLVTANVREFSRVPGLKLEDWLKD